MIADTPLQIIDVDTAVCTFADRIARSHIDLDVLDTIIEKCREGLAVAMASEDGLLVMTLGVETDGTIVARVMLACSDGDWGAFRRNEGHMLKIVRDMGAEKVTFRTDRAGWARMLGPEWSHVSGEFSRSA
jgi:hypothetical protein